MGLLGSLENGNREWVVGREEWTRNKGKILMEGFLALFTIVVEIDGFIFVSLYICAGH